MAEEVPHRVLRARVAEMHPDAPIGGGAVGDRPPLDGDAAQEDETAAIQNLGAELVERRAQRWQREVGAGNVADVQPPGADDLGRGFDLGELGRRERVDPVLRPLAQIGADPGRRAFDEGARRGRRRHDNSSMLRDAPGLSNLAS